jgi:hypothetical protein
MPRAVAALFLLAALAPLVQGQRSGRGSSSPAPTRETSAMNELEREMNERTLEEQLRTPASRREQRLSYEQLSEDFKRIQLINNDLVAAASRDAALDLKFVTRSAGEIRKLAARLKDNLVLPEPSKGSKRFQAEVEPESAQLKSSLLALGKLVAGFAHNPVFKEPNIVDAQLSAKARLDLEDIIVLSEQVRKSSEKLNKIAQKSQ